jgi:hypothetical protein
LPAHRLGLPLPHSLGLFLIFLVSLWFGLYGKERKQNREGRRKRRREKKNGSGTLERVNRVIERKKKKLYKYI